ncbi:YfiR/HmsC family protein [Cellvibrio sp. OA-2007]|uniref:YfiR/HmsC family protein n=1 Tax=Cellvibrio sp. OA-2007 TaxID=529823 RepID=UPI00187CE77F|nr:YfiR/HmsC family protein [Cellvibrio sp. OA-2007]
MLMKTFLSVVVLCRPWLQPLGRAQTVLFALLSSAILLLLSASPVWAQGLNKEKITASYLYNFAKNIEWPNQATMTSFDLAVYGANNPALMAELAVLRDRVKLRNLPIRVTQVNRVSSLAQYHMVYVEKVNAKTITDIYDALEGKPVLLVTESYNNKQLVMINLITTDNDRLKFEVNKSNIINHGLTPLPELILNGGTEIDVAKLYRQGQASLVALQKQLRGREKTLNELTTAIKTQQAMNASLQAQMAELNQGIEKSDALIAQQKILLQDQQTQIETSKQEREALLHEVDLRTQELDAQQAHLRTILQEIDAREKRLTYLNSKIKTQEETILKQKNAIVDLDELVDSQKVALRYLWGSVILGALLIITVLIAYTIKRRDNQRLAAHTQDLQIARDRLAIAKRKAEDASKAKSEFLSLMSHELRTPLQAIIGYTEVVIEELKLADDEHHLKDLSRVILNSERLLKLINGVLDLAKIESGRMDLDLTEVKLSTLVDEALGTVTSLAEKNAIQLQVDADDGEFLPLADPEKLLHILINLLGNAIKFAPGGQVRIKAYHQPQQIYISVADTGIGISQEQQVAIFDPFKQADSGTTRKFQGSGLGLSITRQLCELMGGKIRVESELGAGAKFIVELPLPMKPATVQTQPAIDEDAPPLAVAPLVPAATGEQVVMIDDDPAFLDIMARTIRAEGYQVHTASDAESGWRLIQSIKPDVITLDLFLPDQHGWILFERIKADADICDIPVIVISMIEERKRFNRQPAEEYLTKPVRRETLKLAIERLAPRKNP